MKRLTARQVYASREWKQVKRYVLARDRYLCQIRSDVCLTRATTADHKHKLSEGGAPFDPANLRAACQPCNSQREGGDGWTRWGQRYPAPSRDW